MPVHLPNKFGKKNLRQNNIQKKILNLQNNINRNESKRNSRTAKR